MDLPSALYLPEDGGFLATALTIGPWDPGLQHAGPPAALLAREAEQVSGIAGGQTVRLSGGSRTVPSTRPAPRRPGPARCAHWWPASP